MADVWAGKLLRGIDRWQYGLDCQVAELQKEYCVDRLTGEHMVRAARYAMTGAADLTARVRDAAGPLSFKVDCARVAGVCHVFDMFGVYLADELDFFAEMVAEGPKRGKRRFDRIDRLFGDDIRGLRFVSDVVLFFAPYSLRRCGEHLEKKPRNRDGLVKRLVRVFRAADALGRGCDSDLARTAVTYCDNVLLSSRPGDYVWHELQQGASGDARSHFRHCSFSMGLYEGLRRKSVERVWTSDLDVLPVMLRQYLAQQFSYVPYEHAIAALFATHSYSWDSGVAIENAKGVRQLLRMGSSRVSSRQAELLLHVVEKHAATVDEVCGGLPAREKNGSSPP